MATIQQILKRQYQVYDEDELMSNNLNLLRDFACRFVLFLHNEEVNKNLNLIEALEEFEKYYDLTTDISGNERKRKP